MQFGHLPDKIFSKPSSVRDEVEKFTQAQVSGKGVEDKRLILNIYSPDVTDLTLIDLPGIVVVPKVGDPDNIFEQTTALVKKYMTQDALVLVVVPATHALISSQGLRLVRQTKAENRTLGVLTMLDRADVERDGPREKILGTHPDWVPLPQGYIGVINRDSFVKQGSEEETLSETKEKELNFLLQKYPDLLEKDLVGIDSLNKKLSQMLMKHIQEIWAPKVESEIQRIKTSLNGTYNTFGPKLTMQDVTRMITTLCLQIKSKLQEKPQEIPIPKTSASAPRSSPRRTSSSPKSQPTFSFGAAPEQNHTQTNQSDSNPFSAFGKSTPDFTFGSSMPQDNNRTSTGSFASAFGWSLGSSAKVENPLIFNVSKQFIVPMIRILESTQNTLANLLLLEKTQLMQAISKDVISPAVEMVTFNFFTAGVNSLHDWSKYPKLRQAASDALKLLLTACSDKLQKNLETLIEAEMVFKDSIPSTPLETFLHSTSQLDSDFKKRLALLVFKMTWKFLILDFCDQAEQAVKRRIAGMKIEDLLEEEEFVRTARTKILNQMAFLSCAEHQLSKIKNAPQNAN